MSGEKIGETGRGASGDGSDITMVTGRGAVLHSPSARGRHQSVADARPDTVYVLQDEVAPRDSSRLHPPRVPDLSLPIWLTRGTRDDDRRSSRREREEEEHNLPPSLQIRSKGPHRGPLALQMSSAFFTDDVSSIWTYGFLFLPHTPLALVFFTEWPR